MGFVKNPSSHPGHKLASDVLAGDSRNNATARKMGGIEKVPGTTKPGRKVSSINLKHHDNGGITVTHTELRDPSKDEYERIGGTKDKEGERNGVDHSNAFSNPAEAHSHIGKLLGVNYGGH